MGTDSSSKRKDIHTILSLGLKVEGAATAAAAPQEGEENAAAAAAGQPEQTPKALVVELSPEDLQKLYDTLEKVQSQLDALTDKK